MTSIYQFDIENRYPTYTITITDDSDMKLCEVKDGSTVIVSSKTMSEHDSVLGCRRALNIPDTIAPGITTAQIALIDVLLDGHTAVNTTTGLLLFCDGSIWKETGATYPAIDSFDTQRWGFLSSSIVGSDVANEGTEGSTFDLTSANSTGWIDGSPQDVVDIVINNDHSGMSSKFNLRYETTVSIASPSTSNGFTVSGWVRLQGSTGNNDYIILKQFDNTFTGTPGLGIAMLVNSDKTVRVWVNGGDVANDTILSSTTDDLALLTDVWTHIGFTINAANDTLNIYVNGKLHATTPLAAAPIWGDGPWCVGGRTENVVDGFNGHMFDWRVAEVERDAAWFKSMWAGRHLLSGGS